LAIVGSSVGSSLGYGVTIHMSEQKYPGDDLYALQPDPVVPAEFPVATPAPAAPVKEDASMAWMAREIIETVVLALVIFLLIRQGVQNYRIENHSMEPNFYEGQFVLVNKLAYKLGGAPERGDVVVFHNPNNTAEDYIKRVVGLPGDVVEIRDQVVYIHGQPVSEPFPHNLIPAGFVMDAVTVPPDMLFVMGDNRPNSSDSRAFGPISQELIVGKAWLRIWPLDHFGFVGHSDMPIATTTE
jgi:signal peptidase I